MNSGGTGSQAVTGAGAMALGGSYASGTDSFAAAIANNTSTYGATAANTIALNDRAKASGGQSVCIGQLSLSSGTSSMVLSGYGATASGNAAIAIGANSWAGPITSSGNSSIAIGDGISATRQFSIAMGAGALAAIYGKFAIASGAFAGGAAGDAQQATLVLRRATTDATATVLTADGAAASAINQVILPNSSAYAFTGTVVARRQAAGGTQSAAWEVKGLIRREASAGTTVLVNSALTVIDNTPGWTLALTADTTNGGLAITATGAAATNIRWVATINTSEVTYA